jgi:hypothetical protein
MITFPETLDGAERLSEHLKSALELEAALNAAQDSLASLQSMLAYSHEKDFKSAKDALRYIDQVLVPQLVGISDSLKTGTGEPVRRLKIASDLAERLVTRLRMLANGNAGDLLL